MSTELTTLGDALPREISRVRDHVMPAYIAIGAPGKFAVAMMRRDLDDASKAMIAGDLAGMVRAYEELKGYTT